MNSNKENVLQEMIVIQKNDNDEVVVSGRELHKFLEIETPYTKWMNRMLKYGFIENTDFHLHGQKCPSSNITGFKVIQDHILKLDMAKEISMIQRTDKGKQARQYFIEIEKRYREMSFVSQNITKDKALLLATKEIEEKNKVIEYLELENKKTNDELHESELRHHYNKNKVELGEMIRGDRLGWIIPMQELSAMLKSHGYNIGRNRLLQFLREKGLLYKRGYHYPTQKSLDMKLFVTKRSVDMNTKRVSKIVGATPKGFEYILNKYKEELDNLVYEEAMENIPAWLGYSMRNGTHKIES